MKDLVVSHLVVFLDDHEVLNCRSDEVRIVEQDSPNDHKMLKCFSSFDEAITLTPKQQQRMLREIKRIMKSSRLTKNKTQP